MGKTSIVLALALSGALAEPIVQIGNKGFGREDIQAAMGENGEDPLLAIEFLKKQAWEKEFAAKKRLDAASPKDAGFRAIFGRSFQDERIRANLPGISALEQKKSMLRLAVYDLWCQTQADKNQAVRILDPDAVWEMVAKSPSYRIREEAGDKPSKERWEYYLGDLQVDPAAVLATKGGAAFLDGKEFNDFLREAFLSIRVSAKRGHDLEEIRGRLARTLARHKLLGGMAARKELALQDIRVETAIQKYIDENSLSENLDLKAADMESFPAVKMQAEKQFIHDPASGVDAMRKAWSAKTPQAPSRYLRILGGAAEEDLERRLNAGLGKDEVFGWMQARDFPGSFHEAKEILAKEKLEKELGDMLTRNGIEFPQVRKSKP